MHWVGEWWVDVTGLHTLRPHPHVCEQTQHLWLNAATCFMPHAYILSSPMK